MLVSIVDSLGTVVVKYLGRAYWFDTMADAEEFMRKKEDELLFN